MAHPVFKSEDLDHEEGIGDLAARCTILFVFSSYIPMKIKHWPWDIAPPFFSRVQVFLTALSWVI